MGLLDAIMQSIGQREGREHGRGSTFTRFILSDKPSAFNAYNQGVSDGIARRIADSVDRASSSRSLSSSNKR